MYRLPVGKFALQRQKFLIRGPCSSLVEVQLQSQRQHDSPLSSGLLLRRPGARKRRFFSTNEHRHSFQQGSLSSSFSSERNYTEDRNLESYTQYVLRSQRVPLGTMSREEWDDVVAAFHLWTTQTTGYALDSSERLLQRLLSEMMATSAAFPGYHTRTTKLEELQHLLLKSWLKLLEQHPNSRMTLERSEKLLLSILQNDLVDDSDSDRVASFPVAEMLALCDGWLKLHSSLTGTIRAAELLLLCTADPHYHSLTDYSSELSQKFDRVISRLLSSPANPPSSRSRESMDRSSHLLARMDFLKHKASWEGMELSESTQRAIEEASFQSLDNDDRTSHVKEDAISVPAETMTKTTLSSFEAEAMEKRMINVLRNAGTEDHEDVAKVLSRIDSIEKPSEELLFHLVDFYLRLGDVQSASVWIQRLSPTAILSSEHSSEDGRPTLLVDRLLDAWSLQRHPRAPWRAEEIFREILDRAGKEEATAATVTVPTLNRLLRMWSQSSDPAASRKVREWFSRMTDSMHLKPDGTSLHLVLKALDGNSSASETLFARILDEWNGWEPSKKQEIADTLIDLLWSSRELPLATLNIMTRIKSDNLAVPEDRYLSLLHRAFLELDPDKVLPTIERLNDENETINLALYEAGIYTLIKRDGKHLDTAEAVWRTALDKVRSSFTNVDPDSLAPFLNGIMKIHVNRKHYSYGESFLQAAEATLLPLVSCDNNNGTSPIPLETYKILMVRNWYRAETANNVIKLFQRIQFLYQEEGFVNLRPDHDVYLAYLKASSALPEIDIDTLESILKEMYDLSQENGEESWSSSSCKPQAEAFDVLLLAIKSKINDPKQAVRKTTEIFKTLIRWDVTPNTKTINLVMSSVIKADGPKRTYSTVMNLYDKMEDYQLVPDSHTFHLLISACGTAGPDERDDALQRCLKAFGEIRKLESATTVFTYASLTKSLRRLLRGGPVPVADKVATSTWKLCCEDGLLAPEVRQAYESMISNSVWKKIYPENEEPEEWHRHLPKATRNSQ